jgi:hypothetical protein
VRTVTTRSEPAQLEYGVVARFHTAADRMFRAGLTRTSRAESGSRCALRFFGQGERSATRIKYRKVLHDHDWRHLAGIGEVRIPKLGKGKGRYFPGSLGLRRVAANTLIGGIQEGRICGRHLAM